MSFDEPDCAGDSAGGPQTGDGRRFRILRPHAQGGLGAVSVAPDCELHREVALKQMLERHADDPGSRSRFLLEAEITGGLEHPGIVPVYGLGADMAVRPYYAMRFIKGDSLKQAIDDFHGDEGLRRDPGRRPAGAGPRGDRTVPRGGLDEPRRAEPAREWAAAPAPLAFLRTLRDDPHDGPFAGPP